MLNSLTVVYERIYIHLTNSTISCWLICETTKSFSNTEEATSKFSSTATIKPASSSRIQLHILQFLMAAFSLYFDFFMALAAGLSLLLRLVYKTGVFSFKISNTLRDKLYKIHFPIIKYWHEMYTKKHVHTPITWLAARNFLLLLFVANLYSGRADAF